MAAVRNKDHRTLSGWSAVKALATIAISKALIVCVVSLPIVWLVNFVFAPGAIHFVFGRFSYWRCVGLFAIWHSARARIRISGPSPLVIEGDR
jgi:hypothetical protein